LSIQVCTRATWFCALMVPTYLFFPTTNVTSDPPLAAVDVALFAIPALIKPWGVDQISMVRSSTAAGWGAGARGASAAAPAGAAMFQADVPLTYWSGRCSTAAGRTRAGSTVCFRVIWTRADGASKLTAAV